MNDYTWQLKDANGVPWRLKISVEPATDLLFTLVNDRQVRIVRAFQYRIEDYYEVDAVRLDVYRESLVAELDSLESMRANIVGGNPSTLSGAIRDQRSRISWVDQELLRAGLAPIANQIEPAT